MRENPLCLSLADLLSFVVDNRGLTCPTSTHGTPLIATNCIKKDQKYPVQENVRYVSDETMTTWFRSHPSPGDVIFVCKGSPGRVAVAPDPVNFAIAQDMVALRADQEIVDPGFLYYLIADPATTRKIEGLHVGTMIPHFKKGDFGKLHFSIWHNVDEQRAIAEVLGALDDKIASNSQLVRVSEAYLTAEYRRLMVPTQDARNFFEFVKVEFGEAFSGDHFSQPGIGRPLVRIRDIKACIPKVWTTERRLRETVCDPGDLLIGMDAEFNAEIWTGQRALVNQRVCRVTSEHLGKALLRESLREPLREIELSKSATTVIHLNKADLSRTTVAAPSQEIVEANRRRLDDVYRSRVNASIETQKLARLRDTLLPELMSGRLRVKDAEKQVEDVM